MFLPRRKQFDKWSIPSKWSYIGGIIGLMALVLTVYLGFIKPNKTLRHDEMEIMTNNILRKVLEIEPLCCDIHTVQFIVNMPEEQKIALAALSFIDAIPDSLADENLTFSFSLDQKDSVKIFGCNYVGKNDITIHFFKDRKVNCSKNAILDIRDPTAFCN